MRCLLLLFLKESSSFEARWDGDVYGKGHVKYVGSARMSIDLRKRIYRTSKSSCFSFNTSTAAASYRPCAVSVLPIPLFPQISRATHAPMLIPVSVLMERVRKPESQPNRFPPEKKHVQEVKWKLQGHCWDSFVTPYQGLSWHFCWISPVCTQRKNTHPSTDA